MAEIKTIQRAKTDEFCDISQPAYLEQVDI